MRYLFGDSSESSLDINYLGFLRDAIDFGVAVLQADAGLGAARDRRATRQLAVAEQIEAIEELGRLATVPATAAAGDDPELQRTAAAIVAAIGEVVKRDASRVRAAAAGELDGLDGESQKLRERCRTALGTLLAAHDLPGSVDTLSVRWNGAMHEARLQQKVGFGVEALIALDIPSGSLFAQDLKVERFADGAEIHAPETAGWLKKEVKMVPIKIGRHHVTHVIVAKSGVTVKLRVTSEGSSANGAGAGFDIMVPRTGDPRIERIGGKDADGTFATDDRDVATLRNLAAKLETAVEALRGNRGALVEATLDGKPLPTLERPAEIVVRLVDAMAPVVHEIVSHSLSPRELVLKRLLGGDRREEIFLSRAELSQKIEVLPVELRRVFAPLRLFEELEVAPPPPPPPPAPVVIVAPPPPPLPTVIVAEPPPPPPMHLEPEAELPPSAPAASEPPQTITIDAELPPRPVGSLGPLPTLPGARSKGRTMPPPPPPPPRAPVGPTNAAVDAALRDLEESEPTEIVTSAPRPTTEPY